MFILREICGYMCFILRSGQQQRCLVCGTHSCKVSGLCTGFFQGLALSAYHSLSYLVLYNSTDGQDTMVWHLVDRQSSPKIA